MEKITNNLFYSTKENILFWVVGYTRDNNTHNLLEKIDSLKQNGIRFAEQAGVNLDEVKTFTNDYPPRYQYMRVFYTHVPKNLENTFKLGESWSMSEWLTT